MSKREDNIEPEWLEVNGVKYIECEWDSDNESKTPVNSPSSVLHVEPSREMKQLADALFCATRGTVPKEPEPIVIAKKEEPVVTIVAVRRTRRVHGCL